MKPELFLRLIIVGVVLIALERAGFWIWFVAHHSWSAQGVYIGIGIGLALLTVCAGLSRWARMRRWHMLLVFFTLAIIMAAFTKLGKMGFVNSYAENRLAGKFWYFGYMGMIGAFFALWVKALKPLFRRLSK